MKINFNGEDVMQGHRVYTPEPDEDFPHPLPLNYQSGDYWFDPTLGYWLVCSPTGGVGSLEKHTVIEHDDGTITVNPSILITSNWQPQHNWHGYLEHGVWQEV
jgi:hypothetical protein